VWWSKKRDECRGFENPRASNWKMAVVGFPDFGWSGDYWVLPPGVFSMVKCIAETKRNVAETKLREHELASLKDKEPPTKIGDDPPEFKPVPQKIWWTSIFLSILNILLFVSVVTSEPLTTWNLGLMTLSILGAAWSLATPIVSSLLRMSVCTQKQHIWLAKRALGAHLRIAQDQADYTRNGTLALAEVFKTLIAQKEFLNQKELSDRLNKQIEEIERILKDKN